MAASFDPAQLKRVSERPSDWPLLSAGLDAKGRFGFLGGRGRQLRCIDWETNQDLLLEGHESWVGALIRASDDLLISADQAGRAIAWDCTGAKPVARWSLAAHPSSILSLAVDAANSRLASADRDGLVRLWNVADGVPIGELPPIEFPAYGVAWHPDGQRLVTADRQPQKPRLRIWELAGKRPVRTIEVPELSGYRRVEDIEWGGIRGLAVSPDGQQIAASGRAGYDGPGSVLLYDLETGALQRQLSSSLKGGFLYQVKYHPSGVLVAAGGDIGKGGLQVWRTDTGDLIASHDLEGPATGLDLSPAGDRILVSLQTGKGSYPDGGKSVLFASSP